VKDEEEMEEPHCERFGLVDAVLVASTIQSPGDALWLQNWLLEQHSGGASLWSLEEQLVEDEEPIRERLINSVGDRRLLSLRQRLSLRQGRGDGFISEWLKGHNLMPNIIELLI
jgi:hypothetical protein